MENNSQYLNAFFIIFIIFSFLGIIKYILYEKYNDFFYKKNTYYKNIYKKNSNLTHILLIPNTYSFFKQAKLNNNDYYLLLVQKIFELIEEMINNNIFYITVDFMNLKLLKLIGKKEIELLSNNVNFWTVFKNYIKQSGAKVKFFGNSTYLGQKIKNILNEIEEKNKSVESNFYINFLIGYDLFDQLKIDIDNLVNLAAKENKKISDLSATVVEKNLTKSIGAIDLIVTCNESDITNSLLLNIVDAKIVHLNFSINEITKEIIRIIINDYFKKQFR